MKKIVFSLFILTLSLQVSAALPPGLIKLDGRDAPALKLKSMDEENYDLKQSKGRWVFVHFWAAWCGPCRREMPKIQALYSKFDQQTLEIILINTAESDDTVFGFLGAVAPDIDPLMDRDGLVTEVWQPRGLPATFFVDPSGKLQYLALGGRDWTKAEYMQFLNNLVKQK